MTKSEYEQAQEFHQTFDPRIPEKPTAFSEEEALRRAEFKLEEIVEFIAATSGKSEQTLHEGIERLHHALDKSEKKMMHKGEWGQETLVEQVDALTDLLYFTYGSFALMGIDPTTIFTIVHEANMGKLFPDGKPHYDAQTNKVLKPENWAEDFAPEEKIKAELNRQVKQAMRTKNHQ
ncbi:MAG: HAD family hydrolase [Enterococcus sp.]